METVEEEVAAPPPCSDLSSVAKGKRTKRQRPHSPIPFTVINNNHRLSPSFSAASTAAGAADSPTTAEEEDTARCLILLSRGHFLHNEKSHENSKQNNRHPQTTADRGGPAAPSGGSGGIYACKTCDRVFSSFQALGGHRTSHKKPKNDKKTVQFPDFDEDFPSPSSKKRIPPSLSLQLSSTGAAYGGGGRQLPPPRVHECSYCGAEFASGQALGGHMRRHRAGPTSPLPEPKRPRNGLALDLNFPAPEDESQRLGYGGGARRAKSPEKMAISTAAPALVDCHY